MHKKEDRLTAGHISLYYVLFHTWNKRRFQNPINVYRDEVMQYSGIGSRNTYAQYLKELAAWGNIQYDPQRKIQPWQRHLYGTVRYWHRKPRWQI